MGQLLRDMARRQQRMAYFVICFMLFALSLALLKPYGWGVIVVAWIGLVFLLETGYCRLILFEGRHRRKWWAKQYKSSAFWYVRVSVYLFILVLYLLFHSDFTRYALLALLTSGLICAAIIRLLRRRDEV